MNARTVVALTAINVAACADSTPSGPEVELEDVLAPCVVSGVSGGALCGTVSVFEDRESGGGRMIDLRVLVLLPLGVERDPDPVIFFQGGPGASSVEAAAAIAGTLNDVRQRRELVFVDQRGTGQSNRLACDDPLPRGQASLFGTLFPPDHITGCASKLSLRSDPRLYHTSIAVDDIAEVLETLGYDRVNLFGASYGTRMALVFLRRHPELVRTVTVNGVAPPHLSTYLEGPSDSWATCATRI